MPIFKHGITIVLIEDSACIAIYRSSVVWFHVEHAAVEPLIWVSTSFKCLYFEASGHMFCFGQ